MVHTVKNNVQHILYMCMLLLFQITSVKCAKVLLLMHLQGSHVAEIATIGQEMANRGHDVYTVLPQTSKYVSLRKKGISVLTYSSSEEDVFMESDSYNDEMSRNIIQHNFLASINLATEVTKRHCKMMLEDTSIVQRIKDLSLDIAIVDSFVVNYCLYIIPHMMNIPTVSAFSHVIFWDMGVPALPSFVPTVLQNTGDKMSFKQKLEALCYHVIEASEYFPFRKDTELLLKYAPDAPTWNHLFRETQLFLQFRDEILEWPAPRMPHTIFLPGITYKPAAKLPQSIENIYQKAEKGVIVMSFGSTAGFLPEYIVQKFITVFAKLKEYQIIWKFPFNEDIMKHLPSNVHMLEWLPQNDCLGHAKTILFITHCGNNGQYESLYHGIPMLGFPLFAEQSHNAFRITNKGFGLSLDIFNFEKEDLELAIESILNNVTIIEKTNKYSAMLKDRQHPKDEAVYWIEHVLKFGGAHLRPASMDMSWFQLLMIDIILFIMAVFTISILSCVFFCRCLLQKCSFKQKTD